MALDPAQSLPYSNGPGNSLRHRVQLALNIRRTISSFPLLLLLQLIIMFTGTSLMASASSLPVTPVDPADFSIVHDISFQSEAPEDSVEYEACLSVNSKSWAAGDCALLSQFGLFCDSDGHIVRINTEGPSMLEGCYISSLPLDIGGLSALTEITIPSSYVYPLPTSFSKLTGIRILDLSQTGLEDAFPTFVLQMTNLRKLYLSDNDFSGPLPGRFSALSKLENLDLSRTMFEKPLSDIFAHFPRLTRLVASESSISGWLPPSLGKLSSIQILDLSNNRISGPIPLSLQDLPEGAQINFANNKLCGNLPPKLPEATILNVHGNLLTGKPEIKIGNSVQCPAIFLANCFEKTKRCSARQLPCSKCRKTTPCGAHEPSACADSSRSEPSSEASPESSSSADADFFNSSLLDGPSVPLPPVVWAARTSPNPVIHPLRLPPKRHHPRISLPVFRPHPSLPYETDS